MYYNDKVVWITGASSGIGEHLAYALADQGAKLILSSRNEKELQRVKQNCRQITEIQLLAMDITDFDTIPQKTAEAIALFNRIDIIINNAGISQRSKALDTDLSVDRRIMDINYFGSIGITKALLPVFLRQGAGQIVVISSVTGKIGTPYRSAYAASKHALHGFYDTLRAELEDQGIFVSIVCPGYIRTNLSINALKGDGSKNNTMNDVIKNGLDAGVFAQKLLRQVAKRKEEIYIGGKEILAIYIKRFFPSMLSKIIKRVKVI